DGPFHLLFNMLALWYFGQVVEAMFGKARYIVFYLVCGIGGVLGYLVLWRVGLVINSGDVQLVGASGAILGVLIAAARCAPHLSVRFMFMWRMSIRTLVWIVLGLAVLYILGKGENAGGEAAHLGGAAMGAILVSNKHWL